MTITVYISMAYYLFAMITVTSNGENDIINRAVIANPFDEEYSHIDLKNNNFLPHIEIAKVNGKLKLSDFDVWKDGAVINDKLIDYTLLDADKIFNYVDISIYYF